MLEQLAITAGERLEVIEDRVEVLTVLASYAPRGTRPTPHYHPGQDEHFEVLEGSLRVQVAGVERDLHPGDVLDIPAAPRTACGTPPTTRRGCAGRPARSAPRRRGSPR
jgi:quercetin dioxygenase-like cupin family protein